MIIIEWHMQQNLFQIDKSCNFVLYGLSIFDISLTLDSLHFKNVSDR